MLVLSRRVGEAVYIDVPGWPRIYITYVAKKSGQIRLGFEAPREIGINRSELFDKDNSQPKEATS